MSPWVLPPAGSGVPAQLFTALIESSDDAIFVKSLAGVISTWNHNGAGFDPRDLDKLFQPFQRLASNGDFPGMGTGLASVRQIVERHGGRAWAEGKVGEGAVIYFTLDTERVHRPSQQ